MDRSLYQIFEALTALPVNIWLWFLPVIAPLLVFVAKPDHTVWLRSGRLILAISITYVLWNLAINTHHHLEREAYDACQSQFPDGEWRMHEECGNPFMGNGAQVAFALVLGWIPATAYVGIWEFLWRRKYRETIHDLGHQFTGKWLSTMLIVCSVPVWIYAFLLVALIVLLLTVCPEGRIPTDRCWFRD